MLRFPYVKPPEWIRLAAAVCLLCISVVMASLLPPDSGLSTESYLAFLVLHKDIRFPHVLKAAPPQSSTAIRWRGDGEAGRAFGAAYMASMLGGLFGALVRALSVPMLRPLVLALGSPEFS